MLAARSRFASIARRSFATEATPAAADQKYKVVVVGGGPGGLSGKLHSIPPIVSLSRVSGSFYAHVPFSLINSVVNPFKDAWQGQGGCH